MNRILAYIIAILAAILTLFGLKVRGDKWREKAANLKSERDSATEVIDNVRKAKAARESLADPDESQRLRDKYLRSGD